MEEPNIQSIRRYLADTQASQRVRADIERAREDVTVTIGRAAELFGFSESQLRDWENRGLLTPRRSKDKGGQRLYALEELDKLALLKELMERGDYSLGSIPPTISDIWYSLSSEAHKNGVRKDQTQPTINKETSLTIDKRVESANKADFWQYYISQTLHIALSLIFEDIPDTIAGILLPVERKADFSFEWDSREVAQLGPCLIGWRDQDRTFHTFYQEVPAFDYPSDFRVRNLQVSGTEGKISENPTFVVIQRKARNLSLSPEVVEAVHHLLEPIYEDIDTWLPFFHGSPRNVVYSTTALRGINSPDSLLTFLANQVIRIGGRNANGKDRWKFCCVLLPKDTNLLLQMQTLVVQAQSQNSPHSINKTSVSPDAAVLSLSLRAYQSIHMLFRSPISTQDTAIVFRDVESPTNEPPINSAIAMPIGGENSIPLGVLYIVSEEVEAFGREYQRALRLMGRVIQDLLLIVQVRKQSEERLRDIIAQPRIVNRTLAGYSSENKLINDLEILLRSIKATNNPEVEGQTAFISVDIDNLTEIISKYDDQISINLSKLMGDRILEQLGFLFDKNNEYQIYHAYSDRFYIKLENTSLQLARETAEKLRLALQGNYLVSLISSPALRVRDRVELNKVTVRLGVLWYAHKKLYDILNRYSVETQFADVRATILDFLDSPLNIGRQRGGNCIVSYYLPKPPEYKHSRLDVWSPETLISEKLDGN
jgi:hypothetical protein